MNLYSFVFHARRVYNIYMNEQYCTQPALEIQPNPRIFESYTKKLT